VGRTDGRVQYSDGYLLFPREGTLMAQPFDPRSLRTTGDPVPVAEHLSVGSAYGHFSGAAGDLAYRVEESADNNQLVWMDRTGHVTPTTATPAAYRDLAISPDGRRVAVAIGSGSQNIEDIWVRDLTRGVNTRLTFGPGNNIWPVWSPDGSRIAYCSNRAGDFRVLICSAGGEGGLDSVAHATEGSDGPVSWSPDGRTLMATRFEGSDWNLLAFPAQGGGKPAPFVHTPSIERWAQFSPDGRWVAYTSNESGRNELYVTGYPGPTGKWQISTAGGSEGFWRGDGKELIFRAPDGTIMAAPIQTGAALEVGTPVPLFKVTLGTGGFSRNRWAPTLDGQRFLVNTPVANGGGGRFIVVTHWVADLARRK
jgi:Tol biopolymer transport system component